MFSSYCVCQCRPSCSSDALKNNLQHKHKNTHLTLITFNQDGNHIIMFDIDDVKSSPNGNGMLSMFMPP